MEYVHIELVALLEEASLLICRILHREDWIRERLRDTIELESEIRKSLIHEIVEAGFGPVFERCEFSLHLSQVKKLTNVRARASARSQEIAHLHTTRGAFSRALTLATIKMETQSLREDENDSDWKARQLLGQLDQVRAHARPHFLFSPGLSCLLCRRMVP